MSNDAKIRNSLKTFLNGVRITRVACKLYCNKSYFTYRIKDKSVHCSRYLFFLLVCGSSIADGAKQLRYKPAI